MAGSWVLVMGWGLMMCISVLKTLRSLHSAAFTWNYVSLVVQEILFGKVTYRLKTLTLILAFNAYEDAKTHVSYLNTHLYTRIIFRCYIAFLIFY